MGGAIKASTKIGCEGPGHDDCHRDSDLGPFGDFRNVLAGRRPGGPSLLLSERSRP